VPSRQLLPILFQSILLSRIECLVSFRHFRAILSAIVEFDLKSLPVKRYRALATLPHCIRGKSYYRSNTSWSKAPSFLSRENGEDVFVHHTAIQSNGFRSLQEGQRVQFNVTKGPKGWQAENVQVV
jgi:CspA family cold shock protein